MKLTNTISFRVESFKQNKNTSGTQTDITTANNNNNQNNNNNNKKDGQEKKYIGQFRKANNK